MVIALYHQLSIMLCRHIGDQAAAEWRDKVSSVSDDPGSGGKLNVIRIRERATIVRPEIAQLIMRGARKCGLPQPAAVLAELVRDVESHAQGLFVGFQPTGIKPGMFHGITHDGQHPCVVACGFLPANAFWLAASVGLAYSDRAPRHVVAAVGARLREWLRRCGHDHAVVLNLFHTDRSYIRGLAHFGFGERIGGVIRFSF